MGKKLAKKVIDYEEWVKQIPGPTALDIFIKCWKSEREMMRAFRALPKAKQKQVLKRWRKAGNKI